MHCRQSSSGASRRTLRLGLLTPFHDQALELSRSDVTDTPTTVRMSVPSSWVVCGEASTGREPVAKAVGLRPDIVVLDINRIIEP